MTTIPVKGKKSPGKIKIIIVCMKAGPCFFAVCFVATRVNEFYRFFNQNHVFTEKHF
jgi:hypothetical protein